MSGDHELRELTLRLMRRENLSRAEGRRFLSALLSASATDAQIAAALTALAMKGETVDEICGMAEVMRERAVSLRCPAEVVIDTAGTGSSPVKTFNVSTAAAFVIAGAGLVVAKHGSRAATSRSGSADVLDSLGVNTAASPDIVQRCLDEAGIGFIFAPLFHGATARVAQVRRQLGLQTTFNLLGPLTNPARAPYQLLGVWQRELLEPMAQALRELGTRGAWVVHGSDGLDEITLAGETHVAASDSGGASFTVAPEEFGLGRSSMEAMRTSSPAESAELIRAIFSGNGDERVRIGRDLVIANAAAALVVARTASDLKTAAELARETVRSGRAAAKLDSLVRLTNTNA